VPDILPEVLRLISILSAVQMVVGLAISASLVVILQDWRWSLFSLLAQYVLAGLLLGTSVLLNLAIIKILVGAIATLILYWTARSTSLPLPTQVADDGTPLYPQLVESMGLPLRFLILTLGALVIVALQIRFPIPGVTNYVNAGAYWLLGMGLITVMLTKEPFQMGMGILLFQSGFELFYTALEPALVIIGLTGIVTLMTALLISYLTAARMIPLLEQRRTASGSFNALGQAVSTLNRTEETSLAVGTEERAA